MTTPRRTDLAGRRFGRWIVLKYAETKRRSARWWCRCDCGAKKIVDAYNLVSGRSKSCGCLTQEMLPEAARQRFTTHGDNCNGTTSPEYRSWYSMIRRCENPKLIGFKNYGGRGIKVNPEWRRNFAKFLADMGRKPTLKHTLDRIDNDGNYEPANCRWATRKEQSNNQRKRDYDAIIHKGLETRRKNAGGPEAVLLERPRAAGRAVDFEPNPQEAQKEKQNEQAH